MLETSVCDDARLGWKTTCGDKVEQTRGILPKNVIHHILMQDHKGERLVVAQLAG